MNFHFRFLDRITYAKRSALENIEATFAIVLQWTFLVFIMAIGHTTDKNNDFLKPNFICLYIFVCINCFRTFLNLNFAK
jgi:hypothetical protein